jgi:hypothetical protein
MKNGLRSVSQEPVNEGSGTEEATTQLSLPEEAVIYGELIRVAKLVCEVAGSVTYLERLLDLQTHGRLSKQKSELRQYLERFNPPSPTSDTSGPSGSETQKRSDF